MLPQEISPRGHGNIDGLPSFLRQCPVADDDDSVHDQYEQIVRGAPYPPWLVQNALFLRQSESPSLHLATNTNCLVHHSERNTKSTYRKVSGNPVNQALLCCRHSTPPKLQETHGARIWDSKIHHHNLKRYLHHRTSDHVMPP